jgi:hypothetical protein
VPLVEKKYQKNKSKQTKFWFLLVLKDKTGGKLLFSVWAARYLLILPLWFIIFHPCSLLAATTVLIHF